MDNDGQGPVGSKLAAPMGQLPVLQGRRHHGWQANCRGGNATSCSDYLATLQRLLFSGNPRFS